MSILFGLLLARRFYCRSALSLSPGRTGGLLPRINAPTKQPPKFTLRGLCIIYACPKTSFIRSIRQSSNLVSESCLC